MSTHYYSENVDEVTSNPKNITVTIFDEVFTFTTDNGVFSKDKLDYATSLLLKNLELNENIKTILDVGCGYGPIGIILNKVFKKEVTMVDVNPRALLLTQKNIENNKVEGKVFKSNCLDDVVEKFDMIITNPPIRAGKEVIYKIFEQSYDSLNDGGELWIIIQYSHGAPSTLTKLKSIFNECEIVLKKKGFYIIKSTKMNLT